MEKLIETIKKENENLSLYVLHEWIVPCECSEDECECMYDEYRTGEYTTQIVGIYPAWSYANTVMKDKIKVDGGEYYIEQLSTSYRGAGNSKEMQTILKAFVKSEKET